jgi:hypothetical protein
MSMIPKLSFLMMLLGLCLSGCSSFGGFDQPKPVPTPEPTPTPKPSPPEKKPEPVFLCRFLNGEGRTFKAIDEDRVKAAAKAKRACELYSRNCILLDCKETEE